MKPVLKTPRLTLREIEKKDIPELFELIKNDWDLTRFMLWDPPSDISETYFRAENKNNKDYNFIVFNNKKIIGRISIREIDYTLKSANLGYWVGSKFQSKGFGYEMLKAICHFIQHDLKLKKITAEVFSQNIASQKILEKMGFENLGLHEKCIEKNGIWYDEYCFELNLKK